MIEEQLQGQMNIFDFIESEEPKSKYWDKDISDISDYIHQWCDETGTEISQETFGVWSHVPNLGYRLCIWIENTDVTTDEQKQELYEALRAIKKGIETTISFVPGNRFMVSTLFTDERKRRT